MAGLENVVGKKAIKATFDAAQALFPMVWMMHAPGNITIAGEAATARVYTTEVLEKSDGTIRRAVGRYDDRYRKISGRWLFVERVWHMQHHE